MIDSDARVLLEKVRVDRDQAFEELIDACQDRIMNIIYRMVGRYEEALDLAQETFLKAYKGLDGFKGSSKPYTWLYRIAVNTVLSHRRKASTRGEAKIVSLDRTSGQNDANLGHMLPDGSDNPSVTAEKSETNARVQKAVDELEEDFRVVVVLRDLEGLSYEEVAEILDCPRGTVKSRLHRARTMLKEKLEHLM